MPSHSHAPAFLHLTPTDAEGNPLPIRRKPGRPRKQVLPTVSEVELAKLVNAERDQHVESDDLVRSLAAKTSTPEILRHVIMQLAIESAALRHEIRSAQSASKSDGIPQKRSRRIDALSKMSAITLDMRKLNLLEMNPHSADVQRVFEFFVTTISKVAHETLPNPDDFMDRCKTSLDGWADRLE